LESSSYRCSISMSEHGLDQQRELTFPEQNASRQHPYAGDGLSRHPPFRCRKMIGLPLACFCRITCCNGYYGVRRLKLCHVPCGGEDAAPMHPSLHHAVGMSMRQPHARTSLLTRCADQHIVRRDR
jgi:hypothetical protein